MAARRRKTGEDQQKEQVRRNRKRKSKRGRGLGQLEHVCSLNVYFLFCPLCTRAHAPERIPNKIRLVRSGALAVLAKETHIYCKRSTHLLKQPSTLFIKLLFHFFEIKAEKSASIICNVTGGRPMPEIEFEIGGKNSSIIIFENTLVSVHLFYYNY